MVLLTNMDGALRFTGPDARSFLQGQLTHDLRLLGPERPLLAAHCTPQGRVVAVVKLIQQDDAILALLPAAMVEPLMNTLRRYVLRAKVVMADATADPALADQLLPDTVEARLQAIAAGRPQVYPATREMFVAQMLNLDLIDGISFSKGCYTGQEIVARAHYRGRVKRRMQRLRTLEPCELAPGAEGRLTDGRSFQVVLSAPLPDGRCEFLAVTPLAASSAAEADPAGSRALSLAAEALPLPYLLPE